MVKETEHQIGLAAKPCESSVRLLADLRLSLGRGIEHLQFPRIGRRRGERSSEERLVRFASQNDLRLHFLLPDRFLNLAQTLL